MAGAPQPISSGSSTPVPPQSGFLDTIPGEAGKALETYKQRDATKGEVQSSVAQSCSRTDHLLLPTRSLCLRPVVVRFKATGNAPIMKQNFYKITASNRFQTVIAFLRKELGWKASEGLVSFEGCQSAAGQGSYCVRSPPRRVDCF